MNSIFSPLPISYSSGERIVFSPGYSKPKANPQSRIDSNIDKNCTEDQYSSNRCQFPLIPYEFDGVSNTERAMQMSQGKILWGKYVSINWVWQILGEIPSFSSGSINWIRICFEPRTCLGKVLIPYCIGEEKSWIPTQHGWIGSFEQTLLRSSRPHWRRLLNYRTRSSGWNPKTIKRWS